MKRRPPVVFEGTMFPQISVLANPDFIQDGPLNVIDEEVESKIAIECIDIDKRRYVGELHIRTGTAPSQNVPYKIDIVCITSLQIDDDVPPEHLDALAVQAAHAMAFPAVREMILSLTARQPWGQFSIGMSTLGSKKAPASTKGAAKKGTRIRAASSK